MEATTLPFVIPTEAQRSGGICSSADLSWKCFSTERTALEDLLPLNQQSAHVIFRSFTAR